MYPGKRGSPRSGYMGPGSRHSASQTRVNALKASAGMTTECLSLRQCAFAEMSGFSQPGGAAQRQRGLTRLQHREVFGRDAAQIARMLRIVVGAPAMQRAAVVPDHQVADAPFVTINEVALRRVLHQVAQQ